MSAMNRCKRLPTLSLPEISGDLNSSFVFDLLALRLDSLETFANNPDRCLSHADTDSDGRYSLAVPSGSYLIVAWRNTPDLAALWSVPLRLENSTPVELNLSDATATHLIQR